jgi:hypothetical protein
LLTRIRETPILRTIKRLTRPLRRFVMARWRSLHARAGWVKTRAVRAIDPQADPLYVPRDAGIRPMSELEFDEMADRFPYYSGRWGYMSVALTQAAELIRGHGLHTALELGAPVRPIIVGADVIDIKARPELDPGVSITLHDATVAPWPVADKAYDLFIALQVFEHLRDRQADAFLEVRRVARHAILSLPIDWVMDDPRNCHHQISNERVLSWFAPVVPTRVLVGSSGKRKRLIYVFEDLTAPDAAPVPSST